MRSSCRCAFASPLSRTTIVASNGFGAKQAAYAALVNMRSETTLSLRGRDRCNNSVDQPSLRETLLYAATTGAECCAEVVHIAQRWSLSEQSRSTIARNWSIYGQLCRMLGRTRWAMSQIWSNLGQTWPMWDRSRSNSHGSTLGQSRPKSSHLGGDVPNFQNSGHFTSVHINCDRGAARIGVI